MWTRSCEFGGDGRFLGNLFKKGQGPGEMPYPGTPPRDGNAYRRLFDIPEQARLFRSGRAIRKGDRRPVGGGRTSLTLIDHQAGRFYFQSGEFPRTTGDPDFVDNPRTIVAVSEADGIGRPLATFVTRAWVVTSPAAAAAGCSRSRA
ncbi:MAG: hypothetical protein MZV63_66140 [Marinilabiliales bacterium]|nr:hypothetical protein [Marinilabiliales bacterium]